MIREMMKMNEFILFAAILLIWLALQLWILPSMGIST